MKREGVAKHFLLPLVFALAGYAFFYHFIESRRTRNGPWQLTFATNAGGAPEMIVNQQKLGVANKRINFTGQGSGSSSLPVTLEFSQPRPVPYDVPFGKCVFVDSTFLPGTLTLEMFGHEVELLPRVLIIDHQEHAWRTNEIITLPSKNE
jgi:hypothetical protein